MSIVPKPAPPRYACAEKPFSQAPQDEEHLTFFQKVVLFFLIAAVIFLAGIQVGRNAEKEDAAHRTITYHEDIG